MSNIYLLEPHTNGKVILHTTYGDISIELWPKEAPKACRNFVQLCMEGYYNDTIFHRIVANFIVQGGDPEGTGLGGESVYEGGRPFADEFHSRLRFVRRGLVAMANSGVPNDNRSQFFITLDATMELQNKHTIFGKIAGDTIFNVLKIGGLEVDADERPLYPPKVTSCTIVVNPFDDIIPRMSRQEQEALRLKELEAQKKPEKQKKLKKNVALLSFADDAPDMTMDEDNSNSNQDDSKRKKKMLSSHDLLEDDPTLSRDTDHKLVSEIRDGGGSSSKRKASNEDKSEEGQGQDRMDEDDDNNESLNAFEQRMRDQVREKLKKARLAKESSTSEIQKLEGDIRKMHNRGSDKEAAEAAKKKPKVSLLQLEREQYKTRAESKGGDSKKKSRAAMNSEKERELLDKLSAFETKVFAMAREPEPNPAPKKNDAPPCEIHGIPSCESCQDTTASKSKKAKQQAAGHSDDEPVPEDDSDDDIGWMQHKLVFEKDLKGKDVSQASKRDDANEYIVIDPLNKAASTTAARDEQGRSGYSRDARESRDNRDSRDSRDGRDSRDRGHRESRDSRDSRDRRDHRDSRDSRDSRDRRW
ncbi:MAG: peptidyl-prolyl isomerase cwc27 [Linnemannia elongata]|nr:MAG: peptidyl-prolyl isomerase cwc27 [Linnemannia elongata]